MNNTRRNEIATASPLLTQAFALMEQAKTILESAKNDEQELYDSMSEGRQNGDAGEESQSCITALEGLIDAIDSVDIAEPATELAMAVDRDFDAKRGRLLAGERERLRQERLPKWAKDHLARLEERIATIQEDAQKEWSDPTGEIDDILVSGKYNDPRDGKLLPCRKVSFPGIGCNVYVDKHSKSLKIYANSMGSIAIFPEVSNVVAIKVGRF